MIFSIATAWSYITMVVFLELIVILGFYICRYSVRRTVIGFSALITVLAGLICNILAVARYRITPETSLIGTLLFFHGIYISSPFVRGLEAFMAISRQMNCNVGVLLSCFYYDSFKAQSIIPVVFCSFISQIGYFLL